MLWCEYFDRDCPSAPASGALHSFPFCSLLLLKFAFPLEDWTIWWLKWKFSSIIFKERGKGFFWRSLKDAAELLQLLRGPRVNRRVAAAAPEPARCPRFVCCHGRKLRSLPPQNRFPPKARYSYVSTIHTNFAQTTTDGQQRHSSMLGSVRNWVLFIFLYSRLFTNSSGQTLKVLMRNFRG